MKLLKRAIRIISASCLAAVLLCGTCLPASAAEDLDPGRKGSISLTLYSDEAQAGVTDGALTIYEVAALTAEDGELTYVRAEAFEDYDGDLDVEGGGPADELAEYAAVHGAAGTVREISEDGRAEFSDLALGLYLIVQTTESEGYYPIEPFLVTVPLAQDGIWAYSVDAGPKVEVRPEPELPDAETPAPAATTPAASSGTKLPQTGQLFWPIPILACAGACFFLTGAALRRKREVLVA